MILNVNRPAEINAKILDVKSGRDKKIAELQQRKVDIESKADEQIASKLDPVIQEGQSLERMLTDKNRSGTKEESPI